MKYLSWIVIFTLVTITIFLSASETRLVKAAQETTIYVDDGNTGGPWNGTRDYPYQNITSALEHVSDNDTVYVYSGTYFEHILVNNSVSIIGEDKTTTILDGNNREDIIVHVIKPYVTISGFTIQNAADYFSAYGISVSKTTNVTIYNNIITTSYYGVLLYGSVYCGIAGNKVSHCHRYGIGLMSTGEHKASNNTIVGNSVTDNPIGIHIADLNCTYNTFYHNNIVNNTLQLAYFGWPNSLDNGMEGNYWSDYNGSDLDNDGVGDTEQPHLGDKCPLMGMFSSFNASQGMYVNVISNSTIESFQYFESNETLSMYVSNVVDGQTHGFCRICIPRELMNVTNVSVMIDDGATAVINPNYNLYDNSTHRWIYFAYEHSTRKIDIISELPLTVIAFLLVGSTMLVKMFLGKRRHFRIK